MDIKELEEINDAISVLEELDLPISVEQIGKRKMLETKYLSEVLVPQIQSYIQSLVEQLHKSFCLVVDHQYGSPVEVRIAEKTKIKQEGFHNNQNSSSTRSIIIKDAFTSERILAEWNKFLESLPTGNPLVKFTFTQSYNSLSKLLHVIQSRDMMKYLSPLFEALDIPTTGKVTPKQIINLLDSNQLVKETTREGTSERIALWTQSQKVEIQADGTRKKIFMADGITPVLIKKTKIIKEGKWSLKTLCDLMAQKEYFSKSRSNII